MRHYVDHSSNNARLGRGRRFTGRARRRLMSSKCITFNQLRCLVVDRPPEEVDPNTHPHLSGALPSISSHANLESALTGFLQERQIPWDQEIRATLRDHFAETLGAHLNVLREQGRPTSFLKNRKHLLTRWRKILRALDHDRAAVTGQLTPLQEVLKKLVGGNSVRKVATATGVPVASLRRWLDGQVPQRGKLFYLSRLADYFNFEAEKLLDLLPLRIGARPETETADPGQDTQKSIKRYRLTPRNTPQHLKDEWIGLLRYKTCLGRVVPSLAGLLKDSSTLGNALQARDRRTIWRTRSADPFELGNPDSWYQVLDGLWVPSASRNFSDAASYLGWASLPPNEGGAGMSFDQLTLGLFADKTLLVRHLDWMVENAGKIHSGPVVFVQFASMLCHPKTGYLVTRHDIAQRMKFKSDEQWEQHLSKMQKWLMTEIWPKLVAAKNLSGLGRDTEKKIKPYLETSRPLDVLARIVQKLEESFAHANGIEELKFARDVALIAIMMSNPLRALNLKRMTYRPDNTGHLRRTPEGGWRLCIPRSEFKNIHGAARDRDYDMEIDPAVWPFVTRYIDIYRSKFGGSRPDLVFVSEKTPDREWKGLNQRFRAITRTSLRRKRGFGPHSVRHLYATQVIKQTRGDFIAAAEALHDAPETVKSNYWHLINSYADSARRAAVQGSMAILAGAAS